MEYIKSRKYLYRYAKHLTFYVYSRYNEIHDYDYSTTNTKNGKDIGHFTQLVWKASTKLGVGIKLKQEGVKTHVYIVARYLPKGNFVMMNMGESIADARIRVYGENVLAASTGLFAFFDSFTEIES